MPLKVPTISIGVTRDGATVYPPVGKPFEFTNAEIEDIEKLDPDFLRDPVNETPQTTKAAKERGKTATDSKTDL